jgi:hypothetical protein
VGLNEYYRLRQTGRLVRGADRRAAKPPSDYENKANKADETIGAPGSTAIRGAPRAFPKVRGIALGAFGEFSKPANLLIESLAHDFALKNPGEFDESNYQAAFGLTHWRLKRR